MPESVVLAVIGLLLAGGPISPTPGVCACAIAMETDGWCDVHGIGYVGGVEIPSERLYTVLDAHGHELDLDTFQCAECKRAIGTGGFCEEHRVGFVGGLVYHTKLTYHLARAERRDLREISCPVCRANAGSHGWCDDCQLGTVGAAAFPDRANFDEVSRALRLLEQASETTRDENPF